MQSTPAASRRIAPCSDRVRHIRADKRPGLARRLYHSPRIQSKGGAVPRRLLSVSKPEGILALTGRRLVEYASIP
jgi:hypothetical protein